MLLPWTSISRTLWICVYLLLSKLHKASSWDGQTVYKLVSGLQMERVPSPSSHFYKEYVPLVYQFNIPRWNKTNTVIHGSQACNSTNYTKFFTTCPVLYYSKDMHERFSEYFGNNQPLVVNLADISAKPETSLIPFDCELIESHFDDVFMDRVTIDDYLSRLKSCSPLGGQEIIQGISNYVYNISSIYQEMRRNFYNEYWLKIDLIDGRVDAAIWANAVNSLNSLIFQNYLMEANRWKLAIQDCEAGRIPTTILPPSLLSDTLTDMLELASSQNLSPTVSTDSVGNYYKSQLTDCTFTNETLLVRILIPMIPKQDNFLLMKLDSLPFYYRDSSTKTDWQCEIDPAVLPVAEGDEKTYALVDLTKNIVYESDCKPGKLCHIPTPLHPRKISACATAAFNWERYKASSETVRMNLIKDCPIQCSPVTKYNDDLLKQISPTQFFWFHANGSNSENYVAFNCSFSDIQRQVHSRNSFGRTAATYGSQTLEIDCTCHLKHQDVFYKPKPCYGLRQSGAQTGIQISQLAPVQWYSEDAIKKSKIKEFWNVPESFFKDPDVELITQSIKRSNKVSTSFEMFGNDAGSNPPSSKSSNIFLIFLTTMCLGLAVMVVALALRVHSLIEQLQGMGLNVNGKSSYNGTSSVGNGGGQQVSYRNMGSMVDTDSLLINEEQ